MKISIVTGASSGMGRDFVKVIDKIEDCEEIWVIARRKDRLEELTSECGKVIRAIELDLSLNESIEKYGAMLEEAKPQVVAMVNAAGFGKFGKFDEIPLSEQMNMIDLNCKALMAVTYLTLPYMSAGARVYQLGSLSSFQPVPYIATYGATKAFVLSFTRALNRELIGRGIKLIAVCPGWVKTEFMETMNKEDSVKRYFKLYSADVVVAKALRDMKMGKDVSICGIATQAIITLAKVVPAKISMEIWCRQQQK